MPSIIFVTLKNGEYDNFWQGEMSTLIADDDVAGYRQLRWCGQRCGRKDKDVVSGTLVAVRSDSSELGFTIVGRVAEKVLQTPRTATSPATYSLLVEMDIVPRYIPRDLRHGKVTHWTVLHELGIEKTGGVAEGIYTT
jgi:hypothetical protein